MKILKKENADSQSKKLPYNCTVVVFGRHTFFNKMSQLPEQFHQRMIHPSYIKFFARKVQMIPNINVLTAVKVDVKGFLTGLFFIFQFHCSISSRINTH